VVHGYGILDGAGIADGLTFLSDHIAAVKANLPGKPVIVGETGWATYAEDAQIQSTIGTGANEANAEIYFDQIRKWSETTGITTMLFEAFDEPWKGEGNDGAAEGHWGVFDANRRAKLVMHRYYPELVTTEPTSPSYEGFEFVPAVEVGLAFREATVAELSIETTAQSLFSCTLRESPVAFAGTQSLEFSHDGVGRGGFFSNFDPVLDLGDRTDVVFALSGVPEKAAYFELRFEGGGEGKSVNILSYTPVVAGAWHIYSLPFRDFTGVDFTQVKIMGFWHPFSNAEYADNLGHYVAADILIDDLHFE
jgi:hypothetical protein